MDFEKIIEQSPVLERGEDYWISGHELMDRWQCQPEDICDLAENELLEAYWINLRHNPLKPGTLYSHPVRIDWEGEIEPFPDWSKALDLVSEQCFRLLRVKEIEEFYGQKPIQGHMAAAEEGGDAAAVAGGQKTRRGYQWAANRQAVRDAVDLAIAQMPADHFRHKAGRYAGKLNAQALTEVVVDEAYKYFPGKDCPLARGGALRVIGRYVKRL
jgi:hypothetical protein